MKLDPRDANGHPCRWWKNVIAATDEATAKQRVADGFQPDDWSTICSALFTEYRAKKDVSAGRLILEFETEEDMTLFLLRWA